ncbi:MULTISPECIES: shikimate kinase [Halorubrum]|jgi:shikimate kinase|uniref:Shikimate kinase n=1 Tax=Halorubrum tropicale TaxID=1765655 RepID=A0A0N1IV35_9EURY|nr:MULTISPECIES: shikimate kinase [Halorubrum]KOX98190.1 shikimate kinase [Halorubrum tropicale]RLM51385.1 shikimate kinase [Halorubrum sp. Atlit-28R]TKX42690.1 shikimate kinase [Halorubrum sp. ARQ200]TKX51388.1 shikimate kinase [Halorubrum sp. ASP121]TKX58363.1 shikimate kinase [Halorubrum sp. ASP1]
MEGQAAALGAGTVLNALATGTGAAFGLDVETRATVELDPAADGVEGEIAEDAAADTDLIERCVALATDRWGDGEGGRVRTDSDVPLAAGLKSSSAAANAAVLATCDALGLAVGDDPDDPAVDVTRLAACRLGVRAAREAGVTVTGAFDDATASMLGGVTVTDNGADELRRREAVDWDALVWTPPERAYSADADVARCEAVAPMADLVADLALDGRYGEAMTVNGLAFSAALGFDADPAVEAMPHATAVSLSGTGPSVVAVAAPDDPETDLDAVADAWGDRPGTLRRSATRNDGAAVE